MYQEKIANQMASKSILCISRLAKAQRSDWCYGRCDSETQSTNLTKSTTSNQERKAINLFFSMNEISTSDCIYSGWTRCNRSHVCFCTFPRNQITQQKTVLYNNMSNRYRLINPVTNLSDAKSSKSFVCFWFLLQFNDFTIMKSHLVFPDKKHGLF